MHCSKRVRKLSSPTAYFFQSHETGNGNRMKPATGIARNRQRCPPLLQFPIARNRQRESHETGNESLEKSTQSHETGNGSLEPIARNRQRESHETGNGKMLNRTKPATGSCADSYLRASRCSTALCAALPDEVIRVFMSCRPMRPSSARRLSDSSCGSVILPCLNRLWSTPLAA